MAKNSLKEFGDIFKSVDSLNPDATTLEDASLSTPPDWIDTGCYALNVIMSGSLYKGVPVGRIAGVVGPSMCGKSFIMNKIMANAQKKGYVAVVWDSEAAVDAEGASRLGMDPSRTKYYPVETIEACRNQISRFLDNIIAANNPDHKFIISIDSLGNLASSKELADAEKDKESSDVGQRAKAIKSMMRTITLKAAKARVPILFSNHIYEGMEMFPTLVKNQAGGKGPIYLASILVQLTTKNEKTADHVDKDSVEISHNVSGVTLGAMTVKNRFVPSFLKTELYLNFKTGLDPYTGLFDIALAFNVIQQGGKTYTFNGESVGYRKNLESNPEFWRKVMPTLEVVLKERLCYGGSSTPEVKKEVDELE